MSRRAVLKNPEQIFGIFKYNILWKTQILFIFCSMLKVRTTLYDAVINLNTYKTLLVPFNIEKLPVVTYQNKLTHS